MTKPSRSILLTLALLPACTTAPAGDDEVGVTTSPEGEDGGDDSSGETGSSTSSSTDDTSEDSDEEEPDEDMGDFVPEFDFACGVAGFGFRCTQCDVFQQDCPKGEKCVPYASSGETWDANKCVPVIGDRIPGEPCSSEGTVVAVDDCDASGMCWDLVDQDGELVGTCVAFCEGSADAPECPEGQQCFIGYDGSVAICELGMEPP